MGSGGTEGAVIRWPSARHHRPRAMKRCGSCWNSLTRAISIALPMRCRPRKRAAMRNSPIIGISVCGAMDAGAAQGRHAAHRNPLYGGVQNASRVCRPRAHRRFRRQPDAASEGLRSIPAIREQCHGILGRDNQPFRSRAPLASPRLVALSCLSPFGRPVSPDEPPKRSQGRSRQRNRDHQGADEDRFPVHGWHGARCRYDVKTFISAIDNTVFHRTGRAPPVIWKWCFSDQSPCPSHCLA